MAFRSDTHHGRMAFRKAHGRKKAPAVREHLRQERLAFRANGSTTQFEDQRTVESYKILWANERSAVVLFKHKGESICHHLFFDGDRFYLAAGGAGNVEYFKPMPTNQRMEPTALRATAHPQPR